MLLKVVNLEPKLVLHVVRMLRLRQDRVVEIGMSIISLSGKTGT
jgi:hypothetical protein